MKLIIDIPDKAYNRLLEEQHLPNRLDIEWVITHGTPIPDNATNGDVIKAIFPNMGVDIAGGVVKANGYTQFDLSWWNAPYQKGGANEKQV